jgi:hypothetical protein
MFKLFANPKKRKLTAKQKKALAAGRKAGQALARRVASSYDAEGFQNLGLAMRAAGKKTRSKKKTGRKATPAQKAALAKGRSTGQSMMAQAVDMYHAGEYPSVQAALAVLGSEARMNPRRRSTARKAPAKRKVVSKRRK